MPGSDFRSEHVRSIGWDILWTVLTFGLYNVYIQSRQIHALNAMLRQDKYGFWSWALFTILTFGLYQIYHEYRKSKDLVALVPGVNDMEPILNVALSCCGFHIVADCLQQTHINQFYGSTSL
ncbi:MAG: DUF4234 domain-containing protein [Deltaproteobacteria bacterium]|nr:DUF4234 domain-containing protein [Deltaproteobacteria bacterium]MBI3295557.1 DUF4234 domain-containing protein [Deltaproteobacteria bacterium]